MMMLKMPCARVALLAVCLGALLNACAGDKGKLPPKPSNGSEQFSGSAQKSLLDQLFPTVQSAPEALALGDGSLREGKEELALVYYLRAYDLDNRNLDSLRKMAAIYVRRGDARLADLAYRAMLKAAPNDAGANESLGLSRLNGRRYGEAEGYLKRALASDRRRWRSMNALGIIADLRGNHGAAIAHYRAAAAVVPESPMLLSNIGYSHYLAGDQRRAREYLNQALGLDPRYGRAARNLGLVEARDGHYQAAISLLSQVMRPHAAYNNVGYVCMMKGDYPQAEKFFSESIALAPSYYERAHDNLKQLRALTGTTPQGS